MAQYPMLLKILGMSSPASCWGFTFIIIYRIMSATIRDNILFSHKYDEVFYNIVLDGELCKAFLLPICSDSCPCSLRSSSGLGSAAAGRYDRSWRKR